MFIIYLLFIISPLHSDQIYPSINIGYDILLGEENVLYNDGISYIGGVGYQNSKLNLLLEIGYTSWEGLRKTSEPGFFIDNYPIRLTYNKIFSENEDYQFFIKAGLSYNFMYYIYDELSNFNNNLYLRRYFRDYNFGYLIGVGYFTRFNKDLFVKINVDYQRYYDIRNLNSVTINLGINYYIEIN